MIVFAVSLFAAPLVGTVAVALSFVVYLNRDSVRDFVAQRKQRRIRQRQRREFWGYE